MLRKPGVFYGYWIVLVAFFACFLHSGCAFYAVPLFVKSLQNDFGWGRGEIMLGITVLYLSMAVTSPFVGRMVERHAANKIMATGALIAGLGFFLLSGMQNLWLLYAGWAVVGIAQAAIGQIPASSVVSNWFIKRRGTAIGLMGIGVGAGGFVLAPIVGGYLIPNFGWRESFMALGLLNFLFIPFALLVIKTKPADMGLFPDNMETSESSSKAKSAPYQGLTLRMALTTSAFWLIAVSFLLSQFSESSVVQNQVPFLEDTGFPVTMAAAALGAVGLGSAAGKFLFGWLCDHIPAKYACFIGISLQAAGIVVLININSASSMVVIWLYAIVMGLGVGSWLPTISMLTSTNFGVAHYSAIFGIITFAQLVGTATGPLMTGFMYDAMKTYRPAFIILAALYVIAIPAILLVRRPKSPE